MPRICVRPVEPDDFELIFDIERLSFPTCWIGDFLGNEHNGQITRAWLAFAGEDRNHVLGYVVAMRVMDEFHLLQIATHPDHKRRGVAKRLLGHAISSENELKHVYLEVRRTNSAAISFYICMGFEFAGVRRRYYSDTGEDAMLFVKELR